MRKGMGERAFTLMLTQLGVHDQTSSAVIRNVLLRGGRSETPCRHLLTFWTLLLRQALDLCEEMDIMPFCRLFRMTLLNMIIYKSQAVWNISGSTQLKKKN